MSTSWTKVADPSTTWTDVSDPSTAWTDVSDPSTGYFIYLSTAGGNLLTQTDGDFLVINLD